MSTESILNSQVRDKENKRIDLSGVLDLYIKKKLDSLSVNIPVKVIAVNRANRTATVQPLPKVLNKQVGQRKDDSFDTDMLQFAANGFVIDFPIKAGDVGWVISSDKDTTNLKETHDVADVIDSSTHCPSWGFFIPDYYGVLKSNDRNTALDPYDGEDNRLVISTFDGSQKVSIGHADIKVYASEAKVYANKAEVKTTGDVTVDAASLNTTGAVNVGNGASGLITSMTTAIVQNGIITQIA